MGADLFTEHLLGIFLMPVFSVSAMMSPRAAFLGFWLMKDIFNGWVKAKLVGKKRVWTV